MLCSVDGCKNTKHARGMCATHARREKLYGSPLVTKNNPPGAGFVALGYRATQVSGKKKFDHVRIAEKALGSELPKNAVVHHVDENRANNTNSNLVICQDRAYHNLLHARMAAIKACGDPDKRKCRRCGQYDDVSNMKSYSGSASYCHKKGTPHIGQEKATEIFNASGKYSDIAKLFSVNPTMVSKIKNGIAWGVKK